MNIIGLTNYVTLEKPDEHTKWYMLTSKWTINKLKLYNRGET